MGYGKTEVNELQSSHQPRAKQSAFSCPGCPVAVPSGPIISPWSHPGGRSSLRVNLPMSAAFDKAQKDECCLSITTSGKGAHSNSRGQGLGQPHYTLMFAMHRRTSCSPHGTGPCNPAIGAADIGQQAQTRAGRHDRSTRNSKKNTFLHSLILGIRLFLRCAQWSIAGQGSLQAASCV